MASINFLQGSEWIYWFLGVSASRNERAFFSSPSRVIYRAGLFLCFGLILIISVNRIWPLVNLIDGWKSLWKKLDFAYAIALELEAEVQGRLTLFAWPPCLTEKPLRRCQQQHHSRLKAFSVPLSLFLLIFSPHVILSSSFFDLLQIFA